MEDASRDIAPIEIIAHRGYSARAPENTVAAIRVAMDSGAPAVEWDIHVSASGTPHVFHDDTVDRTTGGVGCFAEMHDAAIESLDAGSWFDPAFAGEPVPTLASALAAVGPPIERIYPEIKAFHGLHDVDRMVAEVEDSGWLDRAVFISMEWGALARVRQLRRDAWIGFIAETTERFAPAVDRASDDPAALVDPDIRIALSMPDQTARAVDLDVPLCAWTINDVETAVRAVALGIRRLTTNEVETLLSWVRSLGA